MGERTNEIDEIVLGASGAQYGERYRADFLELFNLYVESADKVTARRNSANAFFLGINTALLGSIGYLKLDSDSLIVMFALVGVITCFAWARLINSYKTLNASKFAVIQAMERHLPVAAYTAEWAYQKSAPKKHVALSDWEKYTPRAFFLLHAFAIAAKLYDLINETGGVLS